MTIDTHPPPHNILVVDEAAEAESLAALLTGQGYQVVSAASGSQALALVRAAAPALILLDLRLPDMDGYELCQLLRAEERAAEIPIILMSRPAAGFDPARAFAVGGADTLSKPFLGDEVLARVKTHLTLRRLQQELAEKERQLREAHDAIEARIDELSTLNMIFQTVATTSDLEVALQIVARTMTRLFDVFAVAMNLLNPAGTELTVIVQPARSGEDSEGTNAPLPLAQASLIARVIETGRPLIVPRTQTAAFTAAWPDLLQRPTIESILIVPLISRTGVFGAIALLTTQAGREFNPTEIQLAETIAGQIAGSIENSRLFAGIQQANERMRRELALARDIQQSLLMPARPKWSDLDVACYTRPAREVGGDFYTYHAQGKKRVLLSKHILAVGDVSGKGASAALLMATCLSQFEASLSMQLTPVERLVYLDKAIRPYTRPRGQNCALCYVEIIGANTVQPILKIINAGCIPPYLRRADGSVEWPEIGGFALGQGLGAQNGYQEVRPGLARGDAIILTSDGVVEANNEAGEILGFERLEQIIGSTPTTTARAIVEHIKQAVLAFMGRAEPHDDITVVAARV